MDLVNETPYADYAIPARQHGKIKKNPVHSRSGVCEDLFVEDVVHYLLFVHFMPTQRNVFDWYFSEPSEVSIRDQLITLLAINILNISLLFLH